MNLYRSKLFRLIILLVCLVFIVTLSQSIYSLWHKKDIVSERQKALDRVTRENQRLKDELVRSQTPDFVEKEAREKLGLVKEGETIVLMPNDEFQMTNENSTGKEENVANWKQWLQLFF